MEKFDLIINSTLPVLSGNFEAVKAQMLEGIKQYEIEVTEENLSEAKKMATELNKLSTVINKVKSEKVKEISGPIETFKTLVAELVDIAQAGREKILAQVKVFEDKTRARCKELMDAEYLIQLDSAGIRAEFRTATIDDLVGISGISKTKGGLTKGSRDAIAKKVSEAKALQDKVDMRLLQLDNASLKAGLKSPLQRVHVQSFLMADDSTYEIQLSSLIGVEVQRQNQTAAAVRAEQPKSVRFFACVPFAHQVTDYEPPAHCSKCQSKIFKEYPTLLESQQAKPEIPPAPAQSAPPLPPPPSSPASVVRPWNQERLHQMRQHLGDETFFQMFKIVYQPISDRVFEEAVKIRPELIDALEWAKGS